MTEDLTVIAQNTVPNEQRRERRRWMTEEILEKVEERRKCKTMNQKRYRELDNEIKRECSFTKEIWLNKKCVQVEQLEGRYTK